MKKDKQDAPKWLYPVLGWTMTGHFVYLVFRCFSNGTPEDLLWTSHVGTLVGGLGLLFKNRLLISLSLVSLLGHHSFWLLDTLTWLISGHFLFGTTAYLKDANMWEWLQSANHFFTVPSLLLIVFLEGEIKPYMWVWSAALFTLLITISYQFTPPASNVNCAHGLWPGLDQTLLAGLDQLHSLVYLASIILLNAFGNYLPVYLILVFFLKKERVQRFIF